LDFLIQHKVLLVQGTAFNWKEPDHFRIVFLPVVNDLVKAIGRFGNFLERYRD
jgi:alanine-synthesizing transaminase